MPDGFNPLMGSPEVKVHDLVMVYEMSAIGIPGGTSITLPLVTTEYGRSFPNPRTAPNSVVTDIRFSNSKKFSVQGWFDMALINLLNYQIDVFEMNAVGGVQQLVRRISDTAPVFAFDFDIINDFMQITINLVTPAPNNIIDGELHLVSRF